MRVSSKKSLSNRLVPKYARGASWLTLHFSLVLSVSVLAKQLDAQERVYVAPDVNIFENKEDSYELVGSGDFIPYEEFSRYNFQNINEILRRTPGVYTREEGGFGLFPNISLRGVSTLRSAKVTVMEDGINIVPAPYSAPDAYYSPLAAKMSAIEVSKGSSQFRYGPHNTGGALNYITTPIDFGQRAFASVSYGSFNDKQTHAYGNYGLTGSFGSFAILGEMYYRENDGYKDFNGTVDSESYGDDNAGGLEQVAPMVKLLWQLPVSTPITLELKGAYNGLDYDEGYTGLRDNDFNADPNKRYVASQLDNMNSNAYTYYSKLHIDPNDNISNTTTFYYNQFARDWYKLSNVGATGDMDSLTKVIARGHVETDDYNVLRGLTAGEVQYKSNNRTYYAYGIMNTTDLKFAHDFSGQRIEHDLKIGYKYHYDKIDREQYKSTYSQAVGGALTGQGSVFDADRTQTSKGHVFFFEEAAKVDKLTFKLGSRLEILEGHYRKGGTGAVTNYDKEKTYAFVPGGGLVYDHNANLKFFGGVYKGFSLPSPSGAVDDGSPLQPEKSLAKEIGVTWADRQIAANATAFHTNFDDLLAIDNSNTGAGAHNVGKVISKGLELSASYYPENILPKGDISFWGNFTFTNATLDGDFTGSDSESMFFGGQDGSNVPYVPEYQLGFGADYTLDKFTFGMHATYHSQSHSTASESEGQMAGTTHDARVGQIDEAFLLNFNAGYAVNDNFEFSAGVKNATDLEYVATRHPGGPRSGAPLSAWVKGIARF